MAVDVGPKLDEGAVPPPVHRPPIARRSFWLSPNIFTGFAGGVAGYAFGHWLGNLISSSYPVVQNAGHSDVSILLGYLFATLG